MIRGRQRALGNLLPIEVGMRNSQIAQVVNLLCAIWISTLIVSTTSTTLARAQALSLTINDDVCGCSAATYSFVLDFDLTCPPTNIKSGPGTGVAKVSCLISPFGAPTTDMKPVFLESISILELDQSNSVLVEQTMAGEFFSGYFFSYSSIVQDGITSIQRIPKALQLNLSGRNAEGVMLMNVFVINFTNECGLTPVIQAGESAGWVTFTQMSGPIPSLCPTLATSSIPTNAPTSEPSGRPSFSPTTAPTQDPAQQPTSSPTLLPTKVPTVEPTKSPTELPTRCPTEAPNDPTPVQVTTKQPTSLPSASLSPSLFGAMSMSMSMSMSMVFTTNALDDINLFDQDHAELSDGEVELIREFLSN